jgi:hypothetical protein
MRVDADPFRPKPACQIAAEGGSNPLSNSEPGEMAVRMLFQIGVQFLGSIAVLHGVPESEIEGINGCLCRPTGFPAGESAAASSRIWASEAKVPSGYCSRYDSQWYKQS